MSRSVLNILIVHCPSEIHQRASAVDHLQAIPRHSQERCFLLNAGQRWLPAWLARIPFDLIVYHTSLLSQRWAPAYFSRLEESLAPLRDNGAASVALPQDEFIHTTSLCRFLNRLRVDHVLSVMPPAAWPAVYRTLEDRDRRLGPTLTGYLEPRTIGAIDRLAATRPHRDIDIGYRAYRARPWLGWRGLLKTRIADAFLADPGAARLALDISTRAEDTLYAEAWHRFLLRCRWTIGVEGGSSLLDEDGSIREAVERHLAADPDCGFAEVERACFPGLDGRHDLVAISPRHLEACATGTAQILVEGRYNGILLPGRHYLPLRPDFSNLPELVTAIGNEDLRRRLADASHADIVASGRYSYASFVDSLLALAQRNTPATSPPDIARLHERCASEEAKAWSATVRRLRLAPWKHRLRSLAMLLRPLFRGRS